MRDSGALRQAPQLAFSIDKAAVCRVAVVGRWRARSPFVAAAPAAPGAPATPSADVGSPPTSPEEAERDIQSDLLALGYHFDDKGHLRNAANARPQEHELAAAQNLVMAVASYVHGRMCRDLGYTKILVPTLEEAAVPEARCPVQYGTVFLSEGYETKDSPVYVKRKNHDV